MFSYLFISVSFAPSGSVTSYNPVIFYFIGAILSNIFYKEDNFDITKQLLPFLFFFLCFSCNSLCKSKNSDLKYPNNEFFSIELIKITRNSSSEEILEFCILHETNLELNITNVLNFITFLYYYLVM